MRSSAPDPLSEGKRKKRGAAEGVFRYLRHGLPVPDGWTVVGPLLGHHHRHARLIERVSGLPPYARPGEGCVELLTQNGTNLDYLNARSARVMAIQLLECAEWLETTQSTATDC